MRQVAEISGINSIALTKLDVLDDFGEIKVCVRYKIGNKFIDHMPSSISEQSKVKPVYESIKGWKGAVRGVKTWNDLPKGAKDYIKFLESKVGADIDIISTSPDRDDTILKKNPFDKI